MARDDIYIIIYKILSYLYSCMTNGNVPDISEYGCSAPGIQINEPYWNDIIEILVDEGYIKGVTITTYKSSPKAIMLIEPKITLAGIDFLKNNSNMKKAYTILKEVKSFIPGMN